MSEVWENIIVKAMHGNSFNCFVGVHDVLISGCLHLYSIIYVFLSLIFPVQQSLQTKSTASWCQCDAIGIKVWRDVCSRDQRLCIHYRPCLQETRDQTYGGFDLQDIRL